MKKLCIITVFSLIILTGCASKDEKYKNISDIVVGLYSSEIYDDSSLEAHEKELVDKQLSMLKLETELYDIEEYMIYSDAFKTSVPDSPEIVIQNDRCYMRFSEVEFINKGSEMSPEAILICKGYRVHLYHDSFGLEYNDLIQNPVYDYKYYGSKQVEDGYKFMYISNYDETGLSVYITTENDIVTGIFAVFEKTEELSNFSIPWLLIIIGIVIIVLGVGAFFLFRKKDTPPPVQSTPWIP